jgi:Chromo (CHRromatin Organisation MOdifier) domain
MMSVLNKHRRLLTQDSIPTGSIVMLIDPVRANKFEPKYIGPYTVARRARHGGYVLRDATGDILDRQVPADQLKLISRTARPSDKEKNVYEVERILKHRGRRGAYEYYTKWKGYSDDFNTWQKEDTFLDDACIKKYWQSFNAK